MDQQDATKSNDRFERFGRKLDAEFSEAAQKVDREKERVIAYLNNEVVPAIRNHSSKALRIAADQLNKLAEFMDKEKRSS